MVSIRLALLLLLAVTGGCGPSGAGLVVREDLPYAGDDNPKHQLDLYSPATDTTGLPLAVFIHGGAYKSLDRRLLQWATGYFGQTGAALAREGFVTAVVGYRQAPEAKMLGGVQDVAAAIAWLQKNAESLHANPRCVVLVGHSGGALLAGLLAYNGEHVTTAGGDPQGVKGAALLAGLEDVELFMADNPDDRHKVESFYGATPEGRAPWRLEPLIRSNSPPTLLLAGSDDNEALLHQHARMETWLQAAQAPHRAQILAGEGHMAMAPRGDNPAMQALRGWLRERAAACPK